MGAPKIDIEQLTAEERAVVLARRAYKKAWRTANRERVKEYDRRFWSKSLFSIFTSVEKRGIKRR